MIRRMLFLLAIAGIYMVIKVSRQAEGQGVNERSAEAQWANEGGANAHALV